MGRLPRVYVEGVLYYITLRSTHGGNLFTKKRDYLTYLSLIDKCKRQYGFKLFAYLLLPSKIHLVIELKNNVPISEIMHSINSRYTKSYNFRYGKKGHLFGDRFKLQFVEKKRYLLPLIQYILLTPIRFEIVDKLVNYPYSSYFQLAGLDKKQNIDMSQENKEFFSLLKEKGDNFADYIQNTDKNKFDQFRKKLKRKRIFGSSDFVDFINGKIKEKKEAIKKGKTKKISKRTKVIFTILSVLIISFSILIVRIFHFQNIKLESKYDKTRRLYRSTLANLRQEQNKAIGAKEDAEKYRWKIRLIEQALEELKEERDRDLNEDKAIENHSWKIKLVQLDNLDISFPGTDIITFGEKDFKSRNFSQRGFKRATYSKRKLKDGKIEWTTTQRNLKGETISWKGVFDGSIMKGVFSWQPEQGKVKNFSFVGRDKKYIEQGVF